MFEAITEYDAEYLYSGAVDDEDGFSDGKGAVVPHDQEHEDDVEDADIQEVVGSCQDSTCGK